MRRTILAAAAAAALVLAVPAASAAQGPPDTAKAKKEKAQQRPEARGQGQQEKARGQSRGPAASQAAGQGRGQGAEQGARHGAEGRGGPPAHAGKKRGGPAPDPAVFNRGVMERAVQARGRRAGARPVELRRNAEGVRVVREDGETLFSLDRATVDGLGYWRAAVVPEARDRRPEKRDARTETRDGRTADGRTARSADRYPSDAARDGGGLPSFCRSGEGHPQWGRDWCVQKGFGLGDGNTAWAIDRSIEDVILRRADRDRATLDRGGLIDVLGDVVFGRLALQSLVLGADRPLEGRWIGTEEGPRVLRIQAGDLPVAEIVDYGRDGRADRILFNLGR